MEINKHGLIFCALCEEMLPKERFKFENGRLRRRTCSSCMGRRERAKLKLDMIQALGGKCQCCGEDHPYFLSLDHVKNDGAQHRQESKYNEQQTYRLARREGWPKDKYQLLCMNCNFAKGHFGECPHKLKITTEMAMERLLNISRSVERDYGPLSEAQLAGLRKGHEISHVYGRAGAPDVMKAETLMQMLKALEDLKKQKLNVAQSNINPKEILT